eukprot:616219-Rhodomonas_salina.1
MICLKDSAVPDSEPHSERVLEHWSLQLLCCRTVPLLLSLRGTNNIILWQAMVPGPKYGWSRIKMQAISGACQEPTEPEARTHTITMLEDPQH